MTKNYCSRECLLKDSEEKHSKFCHKSEEETKVKRDAKARVEDGLKRLEADMEKALKLEQPEKFKKRMEEIKELCVKQGGQDKRESEGKKSNKGKVKK